MVDAVFAYVAMKVCPDLDPGQAFGGYVEGVTDAGGFLEGYFSSVFYSSV